MKFIEMTSPLLATIPRDDVLVMIPITAVEQHGPHMPTGTDTILLTAVAETLEEQMPEQLLLLPAYWLGASAHHLKFGATLDLDLSVYIETLCQLAAPLIKDRFTRFLFLNGHGGNIDPLKVALRKLQQEYPHTLLAGGTYWANAEDLLNDILEGVHKFVGHACEFETSLMMHLRPDLVRTELLADAGELVPDVVDGLFISQDMQQRTKEGYTGRPDLATAEKGRLLLEGIVERLKSTIRFLLQEKVGQAPA